MAETSTRPRTEEKDGRARLSRPTPEQRRADREQRRAERRGARESRRAARQVLGSRFRPLLTSAQRVGRNFLRGAWDVLADSIARRSGIPRGDRSGGGQGGGGRQSGGGQFGGGGGQFEGNGQSRGGGGQFGGGQQFGGGGQFGGDAPNGMSQAQEKNLDKYLGGNGGERGLDEQLKALENLTAQVLAMIDGSALRRMDTERNQQLLNGLLDQQTQLRQFQEPAPPYAPHTSPPSYQGPGAQHGVQEFYGPTQNQPPAQDPSQGPTRTAGYDNNVVEFYAPTTARSAEPAPADRWGRDAQPPATEKVTGQQQERPDVSATLSAPPQLPAFVPLAPMDTSFLSPERQQQERPDVSATLSAPPQLPAFVPLAPMDTSFLSPERQQQERPDVSATLSAPPQLPAFVPTAPLDTNFLSASASASQEPVSPLPKNATLSTAPYEPVSPVTPRATLATPVSPVSPPGSPGMQSADVARVVPSAGMVAQFNPVQGSEPRNSSDRGRPAANTPSTAPNAGVKRAAVR
ncbi:hypothetical protein ACIO13_24925 [Streptomyces sp. NPDC087425]|uniref:hypothetical protein n=1 Tax=Streptomyces sp. NPDC087425 TaxID=3365787 RepID=UPI003827C537